MPPEAPGITIKVIGVRESQERLRAYKRGIDKAEFKAVSKGSKLVERGIKEDLRSGAHGIMSKRKLRQSFTSAVFSIAKGIIGLIGSALVYARIHEFGGKITPKRARNLTIPFRGLPQGARAADYPDAFVLSVNGKTFLARPKGTKGQLQFLFTLVPSVKIPARHYVSKTTKRVSPAVLAVLSRAVTAETRKAGGK